MDTELLKSMFLRARDHYESAVRWAFIIILVCLALHLLTFSQFVRFGKQLSEVKSEMAQLSEFRTVVEDIESQLITLQDNTQTALEIHIKKTLNDLVSDFEGLDRTVEQIRLNSPIFAEDDEQPESTPGPPKPSLSQYPDPDRGNVSQYHDVGDTPFMLDKEQVQQIQKASPDELNKILLAIIENRIIDQRFEELNSYWQNTVFVNTIKKKADSLLEELRKKQAPSSEYKAVWDTIKNNVEHTLTMAAALKFQAPEEKYWWASVSGKEASLSNIFDVTIDQLEGAINTASVEELSKQIENALGQRKALQSSLEENLTRIEENFTKQQSQLTALGKPFQVLSLDINILVSNFPLLLGLVLAAVTVWPAHRLWELAWTADLMAKKAQEPAPWEWFSGKIQQSQSRIAESAVRCLIFWGWIGIAASELNGWETIDAARLLSFTIGGCVAVAVAHGYRVYIFRRIMEFKEADKA